MDTIVEEYFPNGYLKRRYHLKNDVLHGEDEQWFNNILRTKRTYDNGFLKITQTWRADGTLECMIKRDREGHEMHIHWHANGHLDKQYFYFNQQPVWFYERWWPNGRLAEREHYANGKLNGKCEEWDINGNLINRYIAKDGDKQAQAYHVVYGSN